MHLLERHHGVSNLQDVGRYEGGTFWTCLENQELKQLIQSVCSMHLLLLPAQHILSPPVKRLSFTW